MKHLKRLKSREHHKNRRCIKWRDLNKRYKKAVSQAKRDFYRNIIRDLKTSKIGQWYSKLKRLCSYDHKKAEPIVVEFIKHLSDQDQAEKIANKFTIVSQEYVALKTDIKVPDFDPSTVPYFTPDQVRIFLEKVKTIKQLLLEIFHLYW